MSGKGIYQGYALQAVDDKGRVAIPSSLRATLIARAPAGVDPKDAMSVVLGFHESDPCLIGYDAGYAEALHAELAERARAHAGADGAPKGAILRNAMAAETLPFDSSGRFILPPFPRRRMNIGRYAFFYGMGDWFEMWDPATLVASDAASDVMKDAVRFFMEERGETL
ncbi:division/cell wall cluster transcriptional repressor MraZ [Sphingomonas sp. GlSt437]|uniref:division/cell wall cluster transcriptional repressor MraZ n=2 Tax=Bacteria TaxID=2 RepID=UPI003A8ADE5D